MSLILIITGLIINWVVIISLPLEILLNYWGTLIGIVIGTTLISEGFHYEKN